MIYERTFIAGWSDMDFNQHMRNIAYFDKAADCRIMFFADRGFPAQTFQKLGIGPIAQLDEARYFREVDLLGEIRVTLELAAMSEDGSRFKLRNTIIRSDGQVAAIVSSSGGWLNLSERKLIAPPPLLFDALNSLNRTDDFETWPSSLK